MVLRNRHQAPDLPVLPDDEDEAAGDDGAVDAAGALGADAEPEVDPDSDFESDFAPDSAAADPVLEDDSPPSDVLLPLTAGALLPSPEPGFLPLSRKSVTYQPEPFS
jgi:hypothetical protein